jgi:cell cycle protein kinase DBF2
MMASKAKLSPVKLDPPPNQSAAESPSMSTPAKPEKAIHKSKNNVLESTSPNTLASKLDAMSINASPASSPTKRVYHASPAKENRPAGEKIQINLRPPEDESPGMSEQAKKSLRSINALRGLTMDEIELINKPQVKRLATVTQLCTLCPYMLTRLYRSLF